MSKAFQGGAPLGRTISDKAPVVRASSPSKRRNGAKLEKLRAEQAALRMDPKASASSGGWSIRCPAHKDSSPSLSIHDKADGGLLLHCHAGCTHDDVRAKFEEAGIAVGSSVGAAVKPDTSGNIAILQRRGWKIIAAYPYLDESGAMLYENVRLELHAHGERHKTFRQRRRGSDGGFIENLNGVRRVPYRLPEILRRIGEDVHIAEGEKDSGTLSERGLLSTSIGHVSTVDLAAFRERQVLIHEDNDKAGRDKAAALAGALSSIATTVRIVRYSDAGEQGDVTDWINQGHTTEELLARCEAAPIFQPSTNKTACPEWPEITRNGAPRARSQPNIRAFLEWAGVCLTYNSFTLLASATINGEVSAVSDAVMRRLRLEADALGLSPAKDFFDDVCLDLARQNSFHPVVDYLDGLRWDGCLRIDTWLSSHLGAEDTPLHAAFGRKHLIAAVRRVRQPGAKHDVCLVIEGKQGAGKSSAVRIMAGDDWYTDSLSIGEDAKGVIEQTNGAWLVEIAELSGIRRGEVEQVKTMISRQRDRARGAYDKFVSDRARQFVLFGTVNESEYLRDASGNRRFWPVRSGRIDLKALARDRDQLWAEAAYYEAQGEGNELPGQMWIEAARAQEERLVTDPWQETLEPLLDGRLGCVLTEALWKKLGVDGHRRDGNLGQRLNRVMKDLGFAKTRRRHNGELAYCYANSKDTNWLSLL